MKSASFFLLAILCALASVDGLNTPSASDSPSAMRLFKRDLSPNPAAESHSGCRMKKGLQKRDGGKGGCATHTDTGIQIGECWSNTRVMGQKAAFFSPVSPGEKSYRNEGGPYGSCTATSCYPDEDSMEEDDQLAYFCFFWDGTDTTKRVFSSSRGQVGKPSDLEERATADDLDEEGSAGDVLAQSNKLSQHKDSETDCDQTDSNGHHGHPGGNGHHGHPGGNGHRGHPGSKNGKLSGAGVQAGDKGILGGGSPEGIPKAPGSQVIPPPMVCPSNLGNCYSKDYFEPGGKLQNYANVIPTYKGDWFSGKDEKHQYMFCDGFDRGCPTPTMGQLQTDKLKSVGCDVNKCRNHYDLHGTRIKGVQDTFGSNTTPKTPGSKSGSKSGNPSTESKGASDASKPSDPSSDAGVAQHKRHLRKMNRVAARSEHF